MDKEETLLKKRILDLAEMAFQREIPSYTDFLNLNEQTIFHSMERQLPPVRFTLTGGYEPAERKIVCFLPSYEEETVYLPIRIVKAMPVNARFAQELTHRDYLGALMNLGIERGMLGDIVINRDGCFIFCLEKMASYVAGELRQVKRTSVSCRIVDQVSEFPAPVSEKLSGSIASLRLDNVLAMVCGTSRTKVLPYIQGEKVFIDGKLCPSASHTLRGGEVISVRGVGKFLFEGVENETKKGRLFVTAQKYS